MEKPLTREHFRKHIPNRLRIRVRIYLSIAVGIICAIAYRLFVDGGDLWYALLAFAVGLVVGILVSRMYKISWDENAQKVVSRLDEVGIILLVSYIAFELFGEHLLRQFFAGPMILTMILSLVGGAVLGRGIGMGRMITRILRENV